MLFVFVIVLNTNVMCVALIVVWIIIFGLESPFCYEYSIWLIEKAVKMANGYGLFVCGCLPEGCVEWVLLELLAMLNFV